MTMLFIILCITLSIGFYHLGKHNGYREGHQNGWADGMKDESTLETALRNKISDLEKTLGRVAVGDIKEPKKRGRAKLSV